MKPPYDITPEILKWISSISEKIGEANALFLSKPSPQLRKQNQIKTIHSSLQIEGNTLSEDQITALLEDKRVIGPQKDILEVLNTVSLYENLDSLKSTSEKSFLIGLVGISASELLFEAGQIGNCSVKNDVLPVKEAPAQVKGLIGQRFFIVETFAVGIVINPG